MENKARDQINAWLKAEGRKLTWLAKQIPVNRTTLWVWMTGATVPKLEHRRKLEQVTGLSVAKEETWL